VTGPVSDRGSVAQVTRPPSHLFFAILSLLFFWPLAIVSIVYSTQVSTKWSMGDIAGAKMASENAKKFAIWSLVAWVISLVLLVVMRLLLALSTQSVS